MLDRLRAVLERRLAKLTVSPPVEPAPQKNPNDQEVRDWRTRGNQHLADGNLEEAENCFREAQSRNANDSNTLTCLGYTLKELGRFVEARVQLRQAVALIGNAPEAHEANYLIGQIAEQTGDLQSAKIQYLEVLRLEPDPAKTARMDELSAKANEGRLTRTEESEYWSAIHAGKMISMLKLQARLFLKRASA